MSDKTDVIDIIEPELPRLGGQMQSVRQHRQGQALPADARRPHQRLDDRRAHRLWLTEVRRFESCGSWEQRNVTLCSQKRRGDPVSIVAAHRNGSSTDADVSADWKLDGRAAV
jgi:hypothetical protein